MSNSWILKSSDPRTVFRVLIPGGLKHLMILYIICSTTAKLAKLHVLMHYG